MRDGFPFYAFWNGEQMRDLFEALAHITSLAGYGLLAQCAVLLGFLLVMLFGAVRHQGRPVIAYFACAVLFWFAAIVPRVTVVIEDVRSHAVYVVDNVPLSVGVFGSWTSQIGHFLTESYETAFTPVESTQYSQFGAVYPQRIIEALQAVGPLTPQGETELKAVAAGCIVPEMISDPRKARQVAQSSDLWGLVSGAGWVNPARMTAFSDGTVRYCPQALQLFAQTLQTVELPAIKTLLGSRFAPKEANPGTVLASSVQEAETLLLGLSRTMDESLRHSLLLTAIPKAVEATAAENNAPLAAAVGLAKAQGSLAAELNYRTMARIAEESLPKMRNAIEFLLIAMFPVVALLALASGQAMSVLLRTYFVLLFSIELWPALASVINYLHIAVDAHPFTALSQAFGGNSLQAAALIRETGASSQAISGWLMISVPFIAFAIVKGGDIALTHLTSGLTQPAQSAATSQGASLAAGNVTQGSVALGNVSQHNISSHKADASVRTAEAGMLTSQTAYGSVTRASAGSITAASRTGIDLGVSASVSQSWDRSRTSQHAVTTSMGWTDAAQFSIAQAAASANTTQQSFARALREALTDTQNTATSISRQSSHGSDLSVMHSTGISSAQEMRESQMLTSGAGLGVGRTPPLAPLESSGQSLDTNPGNPVGETLPSSLGTSPRIATAVAAASRLSAAPRPVHPQAGIDWRNMQAQTVIDQATGRRETRSNQEEREALTRVHSALDQIASTHANEDVRQAAREFRASISQAHTAQRVEGRTFATTVAGSSSLGEQKSSSMATSVNQDVELLRAALDRFGSPEAALRALHESPSRAQLAAQSFGATRRQAHPHDALGPATMESAVERNVPLRHQGPVQVQAFAQKSEESVPMKEARQPPLPSAPEPNDPLFHTPVQENRTALHASIQEKIAAHRLDLALERGSLLVAAAAWRERNADGTHSIWKNAFLGALGYQSGEDLHLRLKKEAAENKHLASVLRAWGQEKDPRWETSDWKTLQETLR